MAQSARGALPLPERIPHVTSASRLGDTIFLTSYVFDGERRGQIIKVQAEGLQNSGPGFRVVDRRATAGTFHHSTLERDGALLMVASGSSGVEIRSAALDSIAEVPLGDISYHHSTVQGTRLLATSNAGTCHLLDLVACKTAASYKLRCGNSQCIHEVWHSCALSSPSSPVAAVGCDGGTLSLVDTRAGPTEISRFASGVTFVGEHRGRLEVGTYGGEHALLDVRAPSTASKTRPTAQGGDGKIIWRIEHLQVEGAERHLFTRSYDGMAVYGADHAALAAVCTKDLVYTALPLPGRVLVFEYYSGRTFLLDWRMLSGQVDLSGHTQD